MIPSVPRSATLSGTQKRVHSVRLDPHWCAWLIARLVARSYLLELLAREGFLVVCVPYNVTFDHDAAAREVFQRFHACYDALLASGLPEAGLSALDIAELPLYSVGHR